MTDPVPLHTPERLPDDPDAALRPKSLTEFIGQEAARENLGVFIAAAKRPQRCQHCERQVTEQDGILVDRHGNPECPDNPDGNHHETTPRGQQPATAESTSGGRAGEI